MSKKISIILMLMLVIVAGAFIFSPRDEKPLTHYPITKSGPIVVFGDSLVEGVGSLETEGFIQPLEEMLQVDMVNAGHRGDTTAVALERLSKDVLQHNPRAVFILLGGNDFLRRVDSDVTFAHLRTIVNAAQEAGAFVILLGVQSSLLIDRYAGEYESLARETGALFVPNVLDGLYGDDALMSDAIHPNREGYILIAEKIVNTFEDWDISLDQI